MKKNSLWVLFILPFLVYGQYKSDAIFQKYQNYDQITSVVITKNMFKLIDNFTILENLSKDDDLTSLKEILPKIESLKILVYEESQKKKEKAPFYDDIKKLILKQYQTLMTVKSKHDNVTFLIDGNDKQIRELVLLTDDAYIFLRGNLTYDDIKKLSEH